MIPYLEIPSIPLFGIKLHPFGLLVAASVYLGFFLAKRRARALGLDPEITLRGMGIGLVVSLICAHLVDVLFYRPELLAKDPRLLFQVWNGLSSTGGFIGTIIAGVIFFRWKKQSVLDHSDAIIYGFTPAWVLGRLGCTIAHDHPGTASNFILAVAYPGGSRHDLGLYEMLLTLVIVAVLFTLRRYRPFSGFSVMLAISIYAPVRFFFEFLRTADKTYQGLTPAQYVLAIGVIAAISFLIVGFRRSNSLQPQRSEADEPGAMRPQGAEPAEPAEDVEDPLPTAAALAES